MKFIGIRDFRNNCGLEIEDALDPDHVHKGAVFSIGLDLPFELLTPSEQKLVSDLRREGCICDADDIERVRAVRDEIAVEQKRERRDKAEQNRWTIDRRLVVFVIIIALLTLIVIMSH